MRIVLVVVLVLEGQAENDEETEDEASYS